MAGRTKKERKKGRKERRKERKKLGFRGENAKEKKRKKTDSP